jgi:hypothetical protein
VTGDHVNAVFEALGAYFTWKNAVSLYRDQEIKGVYWPAWLFFAAWGLWNLYYYPSLGQMWSFVAGIVLVAGNLAWVGMALKLWRLRRRKKS